MLIIFYKLNVVAIKAKIKFEFYCRRQWHIKEDSWVKVVKNYLDQGRIFSKKVAKTSVVYLFFKQLNQKMYKKIVFINKIKRVGVNDMIYISTY